MATARTKCISTKVTDDEYATLRTLGARDRPSASGRATSLLATATTAARPIKRLLAEVLALRTILLNLHFASPPARRRRRTRCSG